jgi:TetR/AcrR family transcriptional repressor of nem operon
MLSKSERTRQFIIEKTAPVFNTKGYAGTSMNDLTDVTGLTKGGIYGNFENKDEVALAAFDHNFLTVVSHLKVKIRARTTVIDKLLVYPETYRNYLKFPFLRAGCAIFNTATEADDTHPGLKEKASHALKFWKSSIEKHIQAGIATKEIKAHTNPAAFAAIFISLIEGGFMQAKVTGKLTELNATMDFLEKMIKDLKR